jgi:peptide/nickel transport system substrate-binding protein
MLTIASGAGAQDTKSTLRVGIQADLKIVDPVFTTARVTGNFANAVYETLFAFDQAGKPQPQMVGDYTVSADALTYSFTLRPGIKWHDGSPVRAADAVASLKRWMKRSPIGVQLASFTASLEAVDERTLRLVLKERYGLVLPALAKRSPGSPVIMPERLANASPNEPIQEVMGSGPFVFKADEWQPGNRVVFEKFKDYVPRTEPPSGMAGAHIAKVDRMVWSYIPDNNTGLSALQTGEIDYLDEVPFDFFPMIKADKNIKLVDINSGNPGIIRPNHLHPPFDNPKARQALIYLVDQKEYMQAAVGDPALYDEFCGAYFICGSENSSEAGSEPFRKRNIAKAKQLLAEAGYKGEPVVLLQPTDRPLYNAWVMVLIQNLRDAGVKVDPQASNWSAITSRREKKEPPAQGGWNLFVTGAPPTGTDPASSPYFTPACEKANTGWPCDRPMLAMIDQWSREPDESKRHALIDEIQKRAYETVPFVILGQYRQPVAVRTNVQGVLKAESNVFWNIEKR